MEGYKLSYGEGTSSGVCAQQLRRQSFNRFDDKLVENILSYLTFSDKVLLESVSKLWKKLIYSKQTELILHKYESEERNSLIKLQKPIEVVDFRTGYSAVYQLKCIEKQSFLSILKKCTTIEKLYLDCFCDREDLNIIEQFCPLLTSIELNMIGLNSDELNEFGLKLGPQIKRFRSLHPYYTDYTQKFLIHCKYLIELEPRMDWIIEDTNFLPNIQVLNYFYFETKDLSKLEILSKKYCKTLRKISFSSYSRYDNSEVKTIMTSIAKFENLNHLDLYLEFAEDNTQTIDEYVIELSKNSLQLKHLDIGFHFTKKTNFDQIMHSFGFLRSLVELDITLSDYEKQLEGSAECLKFCVNLKRFYICVSHIREEFFADIHIFLPNLVELIIGCESEISDKTIGFVSHLKHLKTFNLNKYEKCSKNITDTSVCQLIHSCQSTIEYIYFGSRPKITNKTIETLIRCANKYPKKSLKFECELSQSNDENELNFITAVNEELNPNNYINIIPQNLELLIQMENIN